MKGKYVIFVFVDTETIDTKKILEKISRLPEVIEVHVISGQYDLLAVVNIELYGKAVFTSIQELAQETIEKIRKIEGVRDTNTIVPFYSVTKRT